MDQFGKDQAIAMDAMMKSEVPVHRNTILTLNSDGKSGNSANP